MKLKLYIYIYIYIQLHRHEKDVMYNRFDFRVFLLLDRLPYQG